MMRWAVGTAGSELQVKRSNATAVPMYARLGYVEAAEGEYALHSERRLRNGQTMYMHMRADAVRGGEAHNRGRHEVVCVGGANANEIPGGMWRWMVNAISTEDGVVCNTAERILARHDARMKYAVAVVRTKQHGRREVRAVMMQRYDESRRHVARISVEQIRTQAIHVAARVGWRLHNSMQWNTWRDAGGE